MRVFLPLLALSPLLLPSLSFAPEELCARYFQLLSLTAKSIVSAYLAPEDIHRSEQLAQRYAYVRKLQQEGHKDDPDEPGHLLRAEEELLQPIAHALNSFARVAKRFHDIAIARTFGDKPGASFAAVLRTVGEEAPSAVLDAREKENDPVKLEELEKRAKALQAALVQYLKRPK